MGKLIAACILLAGSSFAVHAGEVFGNDKIKLTFADPAEGAGLLRITNVASGNEFLHGTASNPLFWRICLSRSWKKHNVIVPVDNRTAQTCTVEKKPGELVIHWKNIPAGDIKDALSVTLSVKWDKAGQAVLSLIPTLNTEEYTLAEQYFPLIEDAMAPKEENILFPRGNVGSRLIQNPPVGGAYPSCESQVQFFGFFKKNRPGGFYLGIHDGSAAHKWFSLNAKREFCVLTYAENSIAVGKSRFPEYPVVIAATESPWTATAAYRDWAVGQKWTAKGKKWDRKDIPADVKDIDIWYNMFGDPEDVDKRFQQEIGEGRKNKVAMHWYGWNVHKFDTRYPEFFPAKEHFDTAVKNMQTGGHYIIPYINGRLWDVKCEDYKKDGLPGASSNVYGGPKIENYGSGTTLAAMCPTWEPYQKKIANAIDTFVNQYGVKGVYIDQIGAAAPVHCYNPAHGHPLGGGSWWQEGYRSMLQPILDKQGSKVLLVTENGAEPYMDTVSGFLLWMAVSPDDFPSLPAVYNQHAWYFCSPADEADNRHGFTALISRCLLWGIQPGWLPWLHGSGKSSPEFTWRKDYLETIVQYRKNLPSIFLNGLPVDEVKFAEPVETILMHFKRKGSPAGQNVALQGIVWRSADSGEIAVAIADYSGKERELHFTVNPELYGMSAKDKKIYRAFPDGKTEKISDSVGQVKTKLEPFGLQVFVIRSDRK